MDFGRKNIVAGAIGLIMAAIWGLVLGFKHDELFTTGVYSIEHARFFLREGHTHGMPFALLNLIVGAVIDRLALKDSCKKLGSWFAIASFLLPITLILRGVTFPSMAFAPLGLIGAICFILTAVILLKGAIKSTCPGKKDEQNG